MNILTSKKNAGARTLFEKCLLMHLISRWFATVGYEWAIQFNRYFLDPIGLWPADYRGKRKLFASVRAVMCFTLCLTVITIPCICSLVVSHHNMMEIINHLVYIVPLIIIHLKIVVVFKRKQFLLSIANMMDEDWAKFKTHAEKAVMIRRARFGRTLSMTCYVQLTTLVALMHILPRFGMAVRNVPNGTDIRRSFPLPVYYPHIAYQSPYFELLLILQFIIHFVVCSCYVGIDNFLAVMLFHVCGQLENLRTGLANIRESKYFDRILTTIVEDHVRLIRAVHTIESTFSFLLLASLLYLFLFACTYGLLLISMFGNTNGTTIRKLYFLGIILNTFLQVFLYCLAGQILTTQSEGLYNDIYECDWLSLTPKEAKALILIMKRSMSPLSVTAGRLFPMSMVTFCNILKISLSYVSFLMTKL